MNWLRRIYAWCIGVKIPTEEDVNAIRREVKIDALTMVDELHRAIDVVAHAMPNGSNIPGYDDIEERKVMLRAIIDGKSATIGCDWEIHPTHCVVATAQPNGRALFTIHNRTEFLQKGSQ